MRKRLIVFFYYTLGWEWIGWIIDGCWCLPHEAGKDHKRWCPKRPKEKKS